MYAVAKPRNRIPHPDYPAIDSLKGSYWEREGKTLPSIEKKGFFLLIFSRLTRLFSWWAQIEGIGGLSIVSISGQFREGILSQGKLTGYTK